MTKEERSRLCAAIALSLCVHIAVFAAISLTPQRVSEKEPVMSVRLVTLSGPRGTGGGGGGSGGELKNAAPAKAAQPKHNTPKPQKPKPKPYVRQQKAQDTPKPAPKPGKDETREETMLAAQNDAGSAAASSGADETAPVGASSGEGGGYGGGIGTGQGNGIGPGSSGGYGIADVGDLEVLKKVTPEYPLFSRKRREEGPAVIIARIENGSVTSAVLEKTSGHDRLDASALRAVMEWKFNSEGIIRVRIPFTFRIRG